MPVSIKIKGREYTVDEAKEIFVELKKVFAPNQSLSVQTPYHGIDVQPCLIGTPFWSDAKSQSVKAGFAATEIGGGSSN